MIGKVVKPIGIVLAGILCFYLDGFAAEKDAKKTSEPAKKDAKAASKKDDTSVPKKEEATPAKQEDDSKKVVATVNGENISQKEVNQMLNRFGNQVPKEQLPAITKQIIDGLITQKLITQFIRDSKIEVSQAEIEKELNKVREDIKSNPGLEGKTFEQVLETHGSSIDNLKSEIVISLSLEKHLGKDIDDKKIKAYFDENKAAYDGSERRASHVLVDTREMKTDAELAQALEKIKKIKAEVDSGKDFAEVAKQHSDCPSKDKGGDLSFFKRKGQMVEPFAAAAFALKVGQVSDPVKTPFGYHIIKVTEIKKGNDVKFDDVKQNIKQNMMEEKAQVLIRQLLEKAKIDVKV
ncbi:MAG: hypothetical protein A2094_03160 [Planctomycetes bacterium GWE2_41_14]|nr:MAG: hypothetical protein A2094_03160 [Planctomycetes bacterium GWE2_41_14]